MLDSEQITASINERHRDSETHRVDAILFERMRGQMHFSVAVSLLIGIVLLVSLHSFASIPVLSAWLTLLLMTAALRLFLIQRIHVLETNIRVQMLLILMSGLIWGSLVWLLFPELPLQQKMVAMAMMIGVIAGAGISYAENCRFHMMFVTPIILQLVCWLIWQGGADFTGLALMMLLYLPMAGRLSRRGEQVARSHLKHELRLIEEVNTRERHEDLLQLQSQMLHAISISSLDSEHNLNELLNHIVCLIEEKNPGMIGSLLLLDASGEHLSVAAAPHLPAEYNHAANGLPVGPEAGSCGTAVFRKQRVIVEDIASDPLWAKYRDFTLAFGLQACSSQPVFDEQGEVLGTFAIYSKSVYRPDVHVLEMLDAAADVTALAMSKYRSEMEVQASELRFSHLMDIVPDAVGVHRDGKWLYVNPATVEMVGANCADDLIGCSVLDRVHPDDQSEVAQRIRHAVITDGLIPLNEERLVRMDGKTFVAEVEGCRFKLEGKNAVLIVARDITRRKQAEEERERLQIVVEQSSEGVFITDSAGKIVYANQATACMADIPLVDLPGMYAAEIRGGRRGDTLSQKIMAALNAGASWQGELTFCRCDASERIVERRASPVIQRGSTDYHVCMDRDITDERRQQDKMEHAQRLESLGVLAGGIAHDFNNILTAILGNASLARMKFAENEQAVKFLDRIERSSNRAAELCKQMLAYSGKGHFIIKPVNLSLMLRETANLLQVSIGKDINLDFDLNAKIPTVQVDTTQLQQVMMNLVINASDAIGKTAGVITLRTGVVQVDAHELEQSSTGEDLMPGRYVFLEVKDSGCGMSGETKKKLFDPFYTTKFTGRGLGMSAVLGIVRGHHGAIIVKSELGVGTVFRILLPPSDGIVSDEIEVEDAAIDWCPTGTVLVVDDEIDVREAAVMMLEEIGFQTMQAADGEAAVEVYRSHGETIALVLLDMTMPKLDGLGCFLKLRDIDPHVRVLLSSGYNEKEVTSAFAEDELDGFVQKPYRIEVLSTQIRQVLEK